MSTTKKYFDIRKLIESYPDAWCYIVVSARGGSNGAGKTYSTLKYMIDEKIIFTFLKRTQKDVQFLTSKNDKIKGASASPFKPLNRDLNINVQCERISEGFGAFYYANENDESIGLPIGFILSLTSAKDVKGFDIAESDFMIFDEFIPQRFERVFKGEGESVLSIYMSIQRDRLQRGKPPLKLICLANGSDISNPLFRTLEIINDVATMSNCKSEIKYIKKRGIVINSLFWDVDYSNLQGLELAMQGTKWFENNVVGGFTYNDFSNVKKNNLKYMQCLAKVKYNKKTFYIYNHASRYYLSLSRSNKYTNMFNLDLENQQKRFYLDYVLDLQDACINDKLNCEEYELYDLIINYKKYYNVR